MIFERLKRKFNELVEEESKDVSLSTPSFNFGPESTLSPTSQPKSQTHPSGGVSSSSHHSTQAQTKSNSSNIFSKAGNFLKNDIYEELLKSTAQNAMQGLSGGVGGLHGSSSNTDKMDQEILELLISENREMKEVLQKTLLECEDLKEKAETLKQLEEEASEENEVLKFKVLSMESEHQVKGTDLSTVKVVDELKQSKKQLAKEIDALKKEVKAFKSFQNYSDTQQIEQFEGESNISGANENRVVIDPHTELDNLKMLFEINKVPFSESDQIKVLTSLLLRDKHNFHFFREKLFQEIARRAIENAEFLFKSKQSTSASAADPPNSDVNSSQSEIVSQSRVFTENKKLKRENTSLKDQIKQLQSQLQTKDQQLSQSKAQSTQKSQKLLQKITSLKGVLTNLKGQFNMLKDESGEQEEFVSAFLKPNMLLLQQKMIQKGQETEKRVKDAGKAVFDKNKQIQDLFLKNQELQKQLTDGQQNNQLIYQKNKDIGELFNKNNDLQRELEELKKMIGTVRHENDDIKKKYFDLEQKHHEFEKGGKSIKEVQELQQKQHEKDKELETLRKQIEDSQAASNKQTYEKNRIIGDYFNQIKEYKMDKEESDEKVKIIKEESALLKQKLFEMEQQLKKAQTESMLSGLMAGSKGGQNANQDLAAKEVSDARKAVYEKNKEIGVLFNKQNELMKVIEERDEEINELRQQLGGGGGNVGQSRQGGNTQTRKEGYTKKEEKGEEQDFFGGFISSFSKSIFGASQQQQQQQQQQQPSQPPAKQQFQSYQQADNTQEVQQQKQQKENDQKLQRENKIENTKPIVPKTANQLSEQNKTTKDGGIQQLGKLNQGFTQPPHQQQQTAKSKKIILEDDFFNSFSTFGTNQQTNKEQEENIPDITWTPSVKEIEKSQKQALDRSSQNQYKMPKHPLPIDEILAKVPQSYFITEKQAKEEKEELFCFLSELIGSNKKKTDEIKAANEIQSSPFITKEQINIGESKSIKKEKEYQASTGWGVESELIDMDLAQDEQEELKQNNNQETQQEIQSYSPDGQQDMKDSQLLTNSSPQKQQKSQANTKDINTGWNDDIDIDVDIGTEEKYLENSGKQDKQDESDEMLKEDKQTNYFIHEENEDIQVSNQEQKEPKQYSDPQQDKDQQSQSDFQPEYVPFENEKDDQDEEVKSEEVKKQQEMETFQIDEQWCYEEEESKQLDNVIPSSERVQEVIENQNQEEEPLLDVERGGQEGLGMEYEAQNKQSPLGEEFKINSNEYTEEQQIIEEEGQQEQVQIQGNDQVAQNMVGWGEGEEEIDIEIDMNIISSGEGQSKEITEEAQTSSQSKGLIETDVKSTSSPTQEVQMQEQNIQNEENFEIQEAQYDDYQEEGRIKQDQQYEENKMCETKFQEKQKDYQEETGEGWNEDIDIDIPMDEQFEQQPIEEQKQIVYMQDSPNNQKEEIIMEESGTEEHPQDNDIIKATDGQTEIQMDSKESIDEQQVVQEEFGLEMEGSNDYQMEEEEFEVDKLEEEKQITTESGGQQELLNNPIQFETSNEGQYQNKEGQNANQLEIDPIEYQVQITDDDQEGKQSQRHYDGWTEDQEILMEDNIYNQLQTPPHNVNLMQQEGFQEQIAVAQEGLLSTKSAAPMLFQFSEDKRIEDEQIKQEEVEDSKMEEIDQQQVQQTIITPDIPSVIEVQATPKDTLKGAEEKRVELGLILDFDMENELIDHLDIFTHIQAPKQEVHLGVGENENVQNEQRGWNDNMFGDEEIDIEIDDHLITPEIDENTSALVNAAQSIDHTQQEAEKEREQEKPKEINLKLEDQIELQVTNNEGEAGGEGGLGGGWDDDELIDI